MAKISGFNSTDWFAKMDDIKMEKWKPIPHFTNQYEASGDGRIRSVDRIDSAKRKLRGKILKPQLNVAGYQCVSLSKNGTEKSYRIHRIIAQLFVKRSVDANIINHINGDRTDNRAQNLEWCSQQQNIQHYFGSTRLDADQIKTIRKLRMNGHRLLAISKRFNQSVSTIFRIINKQGAWKYE